MLKILARAIIFPILAGGTLLLLPLNLIAFPFCLLLELASKGSFTKEDLRDYLTIAWEWSTYPWQIFGE